MPDASSRWLQEVENTPWDIHVDVPDNIREDSFTYVDYTGPVHDGEVFNDRYPAGVDEEDRYPVSPVSVLLAYGEYTE